jgi:hypothetical protein
MARLNFHIFPWEVATNEGINHDVNNAIIMWVLLKFQGFKRFANYTWQLQVCFFFKIKNLYNSSNNYKNHNHVTIVRILMPSISNIDHDLYNWVLDPQTFHEFGFLNPTQLIESLSKPKKRFEKIWKRKWVMKQLMK